MIFKKKIKDQKVFDAQKGGFTDLFSKLAERKDILKNSTYSRVYRLDQEVCENVFISSWVGKKIAELPVNRALKNGLVFECENKQVEEKVWELYDQLGIENMIIEAQSSADVYGSSIIILKDKFQNALGKAKEYKSLELIPVEYPFYSVMPSSNPYKAGTITAINPTITIDESHCAIFMGAKVPARLAPNYKFFGMSVYQSIWNALINDSVIMTAVANITYRSSIRHYKLKGLKELVLSNRQDLALDRMGVLDASANIFGSVVMDSEDEMQIVSQSISGLAEIDKRSGERLAAASGIPATLLLGKSPDGQNSTGEGDDDNFVIFIENYQKKMQPALDRIFGALNSMAGGDDNWKIKFKSPDAVDYNKRPEFEGKILENAMRMVNELQLPQEVIERYLLENNIITQDEKEMIKKQTLEFDEIDSAENNES
jgi:uncharacterized protein